MASVPPGMDLSTIPVMANPSGAPPNFINPPDLHDAQLISGVVLMVISLIMLICRLWTNQKLSGRLGLDDYLCVAAFAGGTTYWALVHAECEMGFSRHTWDTPLSVFTETLIKISFATQIIIAPTMWAAKSAILALYIRLFGKLKWLRIICWTWMGLMVLFYGMIVVAAFVYCLPRAGEGWNDAVYRRSEKMTWVLPTTGTFSCAADLLILVLPFPVIAKLHLQPGKKFSLSIVFATGFVLIAISLVSLYIRVVMYQGTDLIWNGMLLTILTVAEVYGTIMVSCAPALSAFWFKIFTRSTIWSRISSSRSSLRSTRSSQAGSPPEKSNLDPYRDDLTPGVESSENEVVEVASSTKQTGETSTGSDIKGPGAQKPKRRKAN